MTLRPPETERPQVDDEQDGRKPRGKVRKPFRIEYRYAPDWWTKIENDRFRRIFHKGQNPWRTWKAYETEKSRDQAMTTTGKCRFFEFRVPDRSEAEIGRA